MSSVITFPTFSLRGHNCSVGRPVVGGSHLHSHPYGQLYYLSKGLVAVEDVAGLLAVPAQQVAWIPPEVAHYAGGHGAIDGCSVYFAKKLCASLPTMPCTLFCSAFVPLIMERLLFWVELGEVCPGQPLNERQERIMLVLLDELASAQITIQRLPFPKDERLVRLVRELLGNPGDTRNVPEWAAHVGMSERNLSRRFTAETGLSFAQWRRLCRVWKARELLTQGTSVQECAWSLGYENVSAFISAFKESFGLTPLNYLRLAVN